VEPCQSVAPACGAGSLARVLSAELCRRAACVPLREHRAQGDDVNGGRSPNEPDVAKFGVPWLARSYQEECVGVLGNQLQFAEHVGFQVQGDGVDSHPLTGRQDRLPHLLPPGGENSEDLAEVVAVNPLIPSCEVQESSEVACDVDRARAREQRGDCLTMLRADLSSREDVRPEMGA